MGTLVLAFVFYVVTVVFSYLLKSIDHRKSNHEGEKMQRKLFWRSFIVLMVESYSSMAVSCLMNLKVLRWNSVGIVIMSVLALLLTLLLILFLGFYSKETSQNFDQLSYGSFKRKHSAFYEELDLDNGKLVLLQPIWFLVRRLVLAVMVLFWRTTVIW